MQVDCASFSGDMPLRSRSARSSGTPRRCRAVARAESTIVPSSLTPATHRAQTTAATPLPTAAGGVWRPAKRGAVILLLAGACEQQTLKTKVAVDGRTSSALDSLRAIATDTVLRGRRAQWLSRFEMCLVPEDASSMLACTPRESRPLSPLVLQIAGARALASPGGAQATIQCVAVSRVITLDTMFEVRVSQVGNEIVDGLAEASVSVVRFVRRNGEPSWSVRTVQTESAGDVSPIRSQDDCSARRR